jgi:hypothetical protein
MTIPESQALQTHSTTAHGRWHEQPIGRCDLCDLPVYPWDIAPITSTSAYPSHAVCYDADYQRYEAEQHHRSH